MLLRRIHAHNCIQNKIYIYAHTSLFLWTEIFLRVESEHTNKKHTHTFIQNRHSCIHITYLFLWIGFIFYSRDAAYKCKTMYTKQAHPCMHITYLFLWIKLLALAKQLLIERPFHNRTMSHICTQRAFLNIYYKQQHATLKNKPFQTVARCAIILHTPVCLMVAAYKKTNIRTHFVLKHAFMYTYYIPIPVDRVIFYGRVTPCSYNYAWRRIIINIVVLKCAKAVIKHTDTLLLVWI